MMAHSFAEMHTARNTFIATLAIADLILCLFTVPVTLADILTKYWPFGSETYLLCKVNTFNGLVLLKKQNHRLYGQNMGAKKP